MKHIFAGALTGLIVFIACLGAGAGLTYSIFFYIGMGLLVTFLSALVDTKLRASGKPPADKNSAKPNA